MYIYVLKRRFFFSWFTSTLMSYLHTHSHETKPMSLTQGFSACADGYSAAFQHFGPENTFCFAAIVFWPTTLLTCNAGIAKFDQAALSVVAIERILINQSTWLVTIVISCHFWRWNINHQLYIFTLAKQTSLIFSSSTSFSKWSEFILSCKMSRHSVPNLLDSLGISELPSSDFGGLCVVSWLGFCTGRL